MKYSSRMFRSIAILSAAASSFALQPAFAGEVTSNPVTVGSGYAYGSLHSARTSSDSKQFIGCSVFGIVGTPTTSYVACSATNAAGAVFNCATSNPSTALFQSALAVNAATYVFMESNSSGNCVYIYVQNASSNL